MMKKWKQHPKNNKVWISECGDVWLEDRQRMASVSLAQGYPSFRLQDGTKRGKTERIHRVVCFLFNGDKPEGKNQVRHLDGNELNNHYSNLAWGNQLDNEKDKDLHGTRRRGVEIKNSILNDDLVRKIRSMHIPKKFGAKKISKVLGIKSGTISDVLSNRNWKHITLSFFALISLSGCGIKDFSFIDSSCEWTKIITASRLDTKETKEQILAHDIERQKHCEDKND